MLSFAFIAPVVVWSFPKSESRNLQQQAPTDYAYTTMTDCYRGDVTCPEGTFCQVEERDNWYPFDVSYINRGRCLNYAQLYGACEPAFKGATPFPRKEDGLFFERSTLCSPTATCTGEHIYVLPPTCVRARDPSLGCMSTISNGCAGRPSKGECPNEDFCFVPATDTADAEEEVDAEEDVDADEEEFPDDAKFGTRMTQEKLEQCASIVTSIDGPTFSFGYVPEGSDQVDYSTWQKSVPDDNNIASEAIQKVYKLPGSTGANGAPLAQSIMEALWPYPVCKGKDKDKKGKGKGKNGKGKKGKACTKFPLPVPKRDDDGGLLGDNKCVTVDKKGKVKDIACDVQNPTVNMTFLTNAASTNGATDYHCVWAFLHTITFNGDQVLSPREKSALAELIMFISVQFDCKVCRNNFAQIVRSFGLPTGNIREDYARWMWQAHNNANEHSYATHSLNVDQAREQLAEQSDAETVTDPTEKELFSRTRTPQWVNPTYEHPWFMTFEDATRVWTGLDGLENYY